MNERIKSYMAFLLGVVALLSFAACTAQAKMREGKLEYRCESDSIFRQSVGDSIYAILTKSTEVRASIIGGKECPDLRLRKSMRTILHFILSDVDNVRSNETVYGKFMPTFRLAFTYKKRQCTLDYDFGLKKWRVCNADGKQMKEFDLKSTDMLRFALMIFPDDTFMNQLINSKQP